MRSTTSMMLAGLFSLAMLTTNLGVSGANPPAPPPTTIEIPRLDFNPVSYYPAVATNYTTQANVATLLTTLATLTAAPHEGTNIGLIPQPDDPRQAPTKARYTLKTNNTSSGFYADWPQDSIVKPKAAKITVVKSTTPTGHKPRPAERKAPGNEREIALPSLPFEEDRD